MVVPAGGPFVEYAGLIAFPRSNADLTSTTSCPACFTKLTGTTCATCGLDVTHPAAAELHDTAMSAAAALDHRVELIGRMRFETAAAAIGPVAASPVPAAASPVPVTASAATVSVSSVSVSDAVADATPRRHFGVQVVLLIVGVSLLAIGAIFFLVYAFITFGLIWRSVIIAAVTIAALAGASLLQRRKLGATAEAIAALAVVFIYLDAFALRANNLFGAGDTDGFVYWGTTLILSAIGFALWHRLSRLRLPSVIAPVAAGPGLALAVAGLTQAWPDTTTAFAAFIGLAASGLLYPLAGAKVPERYIALGLGIVGLLGGTGTALIIEPASDWAPAIALGIVAVLALLHVLVVARVGSGRPLGLVAAGIGGVAASAAVLIADARINDMGQLVLCAPIAAAIVALALEFGARRLSGFPRSATTGAAWCAAGITALTLLNPVAISIGAVGVLLGAGGQRWSIRGGDSPALDPDARNAVIGLAIIVGLAAVAWLLSGILATRTPVLAWAGFAVLILAAPQLGMLWPIILGWLLLGAAAILGLVAARRRGSSTTLRVPLAVGALAATALAYSASWASIDTWWYGSVGAVALLAAARATTTAPALRAILLGSAAITAFIAMGSEGWHINERFQGGQGAPTDSNHFVLVLAIVLIAVAALLARTLSAIETRVLSWLSIGTALVTAGLSAALGVTATTGELGSLVLPEFGTSAILGAALLAVLLVWVLLPRTSAFRVERVAAAIAMAPVTAWLFDSFGRAFSLAAIIQVSAPMIAALVVAALGLTIVLLRPARSPRWPPELGVGLVAVPAIVAAVIGPLDAAGPDSGAGTGASAGATWLVLLLAGVAALLLAISKDGLFGSASARKYLGWAALGLAVGALWWRLADSREADLELYVLPLAGALLLVALLVWRADRPVASATAPVIAFAALAVGILPIAVVSTGGPMLRALLIAVIGSVLLLAGSLIRSTRLRPYLDAAALAGGLGLVIATVGRATAIAASRNTSDLALDGWLGALFLVLLVAALAQAGRRPGAGQAVLGVGMAALLILLFALDGQYGTARATTLLLLFCALYVIGMLLPPLRVSTVLTAPIGWVGLGLATLVAATAITRGVIDPLEWATVALAAALLVVGAEKLRRSGAAGSWGWLAPGILILLLPSLFATFVDEPFLRLVGLAIACLAAIVVGAIAKLQAPLIIGAVVVLIHAIRTFAPQLVIMYQLTQWWVWAVIGGAIILFLGLTFEKRVRDLRAAATRVAALR